MMVEVKDVVVSADECAAVITLTQVFSMVDSTRMSETSIYMKRKVVDKLYEDLRIALGK